MNRGDPARHLAAAALDARFADAPPAPRDVGRVALLVARTPGEARQTPARVELAAGRPFPDDRWSAALDPEGLAQITAMELDVGRRIANGQDLTLFGDNLVLDLALDADNLPPGSTLRAGACLLEVTPKPHRGCKKYAERFGTEALAWISVPERRERRLRGVHLRVVEGGAVAVGDPVRVERRA